MEKKSKIMKVSEYQKNLENPFLKQAVEEVQKNVVKKYKTAGRTDKKAILQAYDPDSGEILGHTQFIKQVEIDEEKFAKVYLAHFSSFFDLQPSAIKVFGYILNQLIPNKDYFYFNREECMAYTGYQSDTSVFKGLAMLLANEIIARGKTDYIYYTNPLVFFNGDRISFTKTYVKKKKLVAKIDPNQLDLLDQIDEFTGNERKEK